MAGACLPAVAQAQPYVVVTQDSCVAVSHDHIRVYFTLYNYHPENMSLCSFNLTPDPTPATENCWIDDFGGEGLWVGSSNLDGGAWFGVPPTEYSYACMTQNESQGGFYITIEKGGGCCYTAKFSNRYYEVWETHTWCIADCVPVPVEQGTWGAIKSLYN
jgi:hypothetical protein